MRNWTVYFVDRNEDLTYSRPVGLCRDAQHALQRFMDLVSFVPLSEIVAVAWTDKGFERALGDSVELDA